MISQIQGPPPPRPPFFVGSRTRADVTKLALLWVVDGQLGVFICHRWWWMGGGCQRGRWQRRVLSSGTTCGFWCAIVMWCFSSFHLILSPIVFFPPHFWKSLISLVFLLTLASSLSSSLTIFSLPVSICWHVCAGLSQSLISALFSALMWLSPPFLIGKLFNPSLCHCAVSLSPSSPFTSLHLSRYSLSLSFPPLCTLTGLFLSLIVMAGSSPLHNAADIFPTGDPHCIWFIKKKNYSPLLPAFQHILLCFLRLCQASPHQQGSGSTRLVCSGQSLGPSSRRLMLRLGWHLWGMGSSKRIQDWKIAGSNGFGSDVTFCQ